ncbi:hypothetical protein RJ639_038060, partial [Escallonia herrerae]
MAVQLSSACFCALAQRRAEDDKVKLGGSELKVTRLGIGAWSWGDTSYWNNFDWDDRKMKAAKAAFDSSVDCGITFFDTAEVYGSRFSLMTKTPFFAKDSSRKGKKVSRSGGCCCNQICGITLEAWPSECPHGPALKDSLSRLGLSSVELYQLHWPGVWGNEEKRLRNAYEQLRKRGVPLASNQVNYSLIYRLPEENGVKAACDELGVTLIAYSPIAQGALTGKYTPENPPSGPRGQIYTSEFLTKLQPLIYRIKEIGQNYSKTPTQVVLNWLIAQENVVPIPGAKNSEQAKEFAGALGWRLTKEKIDELRSLAAETKPVVGFPVE